MKIDNIEYFIEQAKKTPDFTDALFYVGVRGKWTTKERKPVDDHFVSETLSKLNSKLLYVRAKSPSRLVLLQKFQNFDVAIQISASSRIQQRRINNLLEMLQESHRTALMTFQANHDELTGIFNRHGIKNELVRLYGTHNNYTSVNNSENQEVSNQQDMVLFSFDIDRFKSVNDTFGHQAGDMVLSVFAKRISSCADKISKNFGLKVVTGRPGGEEFDVIAIGSISAKQQGEIADLLLDEIRNPGLPSEEDIARLQKDDSTKKLDRKGLPNNVTASCGISKARISRDVFSIYESLKLQSDNALYRAKTDGRNCYRSYNDIKKKHGKVVRHFIDSELIQIDIGKDVGVTVGEVYNVHFPPFSGNKPILESDSSSKVIGYFPQIVSASITVIDVQQQASICKPISLEQGKQIPKDSLLSLTYKGSKFIPLKKTFNCATVEESETEFLNKLDELSAANTLAVVGRITAKQKSNDNRSYNDALYDYFAVLKMLLPPTTRFFRRRGAGLYFAIEDSEGREIDQLREQLRELPPILNTIASHAEVHYCVPSALPFGVARNSEALLFYCNASVLAKKEQEEESSVFEFDDECPHMTLYRWRKQSNLDDALVDAEMFRLCGFNSPSVANHIGLTIIEGDLIDHFSLARVSFSHARIAEPQTEVFTANLAMLNACEGNFSAAVDLFNSINDFVANRDSPYVVAYAKSLLENSDRFDVEVIAAVLLNALEYSEGNTVTSQYLKRWLIDVRDAIRSERFG